MVDWAWIGSISAGFICLLAGILAWQKAHRSLPSTVFLGAMTAVFFAMATVPLYSVVGEDHSDIAALSVKAFVSSALLAMAMLWFVTLIFPIEREISLIPPNRVGAVIIAAIAITIAVGVTAEVDYSNAIGPVVDKATSERIIAVAAPLAMLTTAFALYSIVKANPQGRRSSVIFLAVYWLFLTTSLIWILQVEGVIGSSTTDTNIGNIAMTVGVAVSGLLFASAIAAGRMSILAPSPERLLSSSKAKYKLLHRYVYLVEEQKPDFSFKMFSDILKGRCFDCENDESFTCESLDCISCSLPCPCKTCTKYVTRPQGLVITRQYPKEVRSKYFLQTTPIMWLSTVSGKDNIDPAKLTLLTEYLVNFMDRSQNGVVLFDGLEYLITTNDFAKALKAIDRWTETAMISSTRLILSVDPRSLDPKELAVVERNREVVRPDAAEAWKVIPERI